MIVTLKDITTKITKGTTPTSIGCKFEKSGINFIKSESLVDGKTIDKSKFAFISERTHERLKRSQIEENDILFSMAGMFLGKTGIATAEVVPANTNQAVAIIRVDDTKANYEYVYYYLNQKSVIHTINTTSAQSAQPNINLKQIGKIKINLPDRKKQDQIVSLLSAIDLKISNNVEINDNLHQQAATLFKALFVDLTPFDGTMPPNWTISTLGDATEMGAGGDKPKESSPVKTPLCPYPIYSNGINDYGLYGYTNDPKIKVESVTVSARGTIGYVCLRHTPYVPIVRLVTLIPDTKVLSAKYLYLYLRQLHITGTGTTQQQLTVPDFRKTEIIIPDKNTMDSFTETVTPLFEQIWANEDENTKLAEVRDALLPKLMSGEIDVSDIQL